LRRARAGYSLLEVLVAFAILMMVLAAILPGKTKSLNRIVESEKAVLAQDYALSRLDRFIVADWPTARSTATLTEVYLDWSVTASARLVDANSLFEGAEFEQQVEVVHFTVEVRRVADDVLLASAHRYLATTQLSRSDQ
jgi:type II secretory pathway pseudopilin PulG